MSSTVEKVQRKSKNEQMFDRLVKSFSPCFANEKILGIYRLNLKGEDSSSQSLYPKLLSVLIPSSMIVTYVVFRIYPTAILGKAYSFNILIELPPCIIFAQYWFACVLTSTVHKDSNGKILKKINSLDGALHLNDVDGFYKRARTETVVAFVALTLSHTAFESIDILSDGILTVGGLFFIVGHFFQDLELLMLYKFISSLNARLHVLNDYLKNFQKREGVDNKKNGETMKLQELASAYDIIGEISYLINNVFNLQMLFLLISAFASIIVVIWSTINIYKFSDEFSENVTRILVWSVRYILGISILCFACEKLLSTRNDTKVIVNDIIMDYDQPRQIRLQAKAFMELIEAWPLAISVYDMFFVDITLILKFISVSTTYLIVIIQISHFV